jgi:hypothetical protein
MLSWWLSFHRLLLQWVSTIKIKQILVETAIIVSFTNCNLSRHDIAEELLIFTLNNNHSLTPLLHSSRIWTSDLLCLYIVTILRGHPVVLLDVNLHNTKVHQTGIKLIYYYKVWMLAYNSFLLRGEQIECYTRRYCLLVVPGVSYVFQVQYTVSDPHQRHTRNINFIRVKKRLQVIAFYFGPS